MYYNTERFWCQNNNHGCWFSDPFHLNLSQLPGLPWSLLWCLAVRPCYVYCFGFFLIPMDKNTSGKISLWSTWDLFCHYKYHPLPLPPTTTPHKYFFDWLYVYIYIYECGKGCVFLDLEIDPRVDKSWDRGLVSLPFLLGTSPSHPLPIL